MIPLIQRPLPPEIKTRMPRHKGHSPFSANYSDTRTLLDREIRHLNPRPGSPVLLMLDVSEGMLRLDGEIKANARPYSGDVALSVDTAKRGTLTFPSGSFYDWRDNVRAIALGMEALRKVERYGITPNGEQYRGWQALPPGTPLAAAMTEEQAARILVLGADPNADPDDWRLLVDDRRAVPAVFRAAAARHHPDAGGDAAVFAKITAARDLLTPKATVG